MSHLKKNLHFLRKKSGKTQQELALEVGKSYTAIGNWENGLAEPSVEILVKLSRIFGVSIDNLLLDDLQKSNITGKNQENVSEGNMPIMAVSEGQPGYESDPQNITMWVVLRELRSNTEKLDQLLNLNQNQVQKKPLKKG